MSPVLVRLFHLPPDVREKCEGALAVDSAVQLADSSAAQVAVFDATDDTLVGRLRSARYDNPQVNPLLLSPGSTPRDCATAMILGAHGLLRYGEIEANFTQAAKVLASDYMWYPQAGLPVLAALMLADAARRGKISLTTQERKVAILACGGLTNQEISSILAIAQVTVKSHLDSAFKKLRVHSRKKLAAVLWPITAR